MATKFNLASILNKVAASWLSVPASVRKGWAEYATVRRATVEAVAKALDGHYSSRKEAREALEASVVSDLAGPIVARLFPAVEVKLSRKGQASLKAALGPIASALRAFEEDERAAAVRWLTSEFKAIIKAMASDEDGE